MLLGKLPHYCMLSSFEVVRYMRRQGPKPIILRIVITLLFHPNSGVPLPPAWMLHVSSFSGSELNGCVDGYESSVHVRKLNGRVQLTSASDFVISVQHVLQLSQVSKTLGLMF